MKFKIDSINPLWRKAFWGGAASKQHLNLNKKDSKKAFTLAEVIIVLSVLGIVAALTVPSLIKHQTELTNRTKIKRAIADYDRVIQNITIENDLHSDTELAQWADTKAKNNCANTSKYFKVASGSGCTFKTPDGVWWDIDDIMYPIIALKEADLSNPDNETTFKLVTSYDANVRAFRSNDLAYELTGENKDDMKKLFSFVNNDKKEETQPEDVDNEKPISLYDILDSEICSHDIKTQCRGAVDPLDYGGYRGPYIYYDDKGNGVVLNCFASGECWIIETIPNQSE